MLIHRTAFRVLTVLLVAAIASASLLVIKVSAATLTLQEIGVSSVGGRRISS